MRALSRTIRPPKLKRRPNGVRSWTARVTSFWLRDSTAPARARSQGRRRFEGHTLRLLQGQRRTFKAAVAIESASRAEAIVKFDATDEDVERTLTWVGVRFMQKLRERHSRSLVSGFRRIELQAIRRARQEAETEDAG
jgi:hypothetical protein